MRIGKEYHFEAAHHLPGHQGKCARPHGHSYKVQIVVEGEVVRDEERPDYLMVIDFDQLDTVVKPLIEALDHSDLNVTAVEELGVKRTTAEALAKGIAMFVHEGIGNLQRGGFTSGPPALYVLSVRVYETAKAYAEWRRM